jgi:uncharacterized membrane protein YqhA
MYYVVHYNVGETMERLLLLMMFLFLWAIITIVVTREKEKFTEEERRCLRDLPVVSLMIVIFLSGVGIPDLGLVAGYLVIFVWGGYCFFIKKGR